MLAPPTLTPETSARNFTISAFLTCIAIGFGGLLMKIFDVVRPVKFAKLNTVELLSKDIVRGNC